MVVKCFLLNLPEAVTFTNVDDGRDSKEAKFLARRAVRFELAVLLKTAAELAIDIYCVDVAALIPVVFVAFVVVHVFLAETFVFAAAVILIVKMVVVVAMFVKIFFDANVAEGFVVDVFAAAVVIDVMIDAIATEDLDIVAAVDIIVTSAALTVVLTIPVAVNIDSSKFAFEPLVVNIIPKAILVDAVVGTIPVDAPIAIIFAVLAFVPVGSPVDNLSVAVIIDGTDLLKSFAAIAWKLLDASEAA